MMIIKDGRNSGGPPNPPQDPPHGMEEGNVVEESSSADTRTHLTQLQTSSEGQKKTVNGNLQRGAKRKLIRGSSDEDDDDDDDDDDEPSTRRSMVLSPASSSSCHSTGGVVSHPVVGESPKTRLEETPTSTSVKDLENAMSKHLPACKSPTHQPTDFSTDALLKQQQRTTIQWIGAHHQQLQQQGPLPASALLRQLYANRESVIRANVHGITAGSSARPASSTSYYGSEPQVGTLPTPPGSEGSSSYSDHQFLLSQHQNYSTGYGGMDYHSAMTPPSSVSPRDKHQQLHGGVAFDTPVYQDVLRHQYPDGPLPLKPQVYSYVDQSQFYHHGAAGAGFHLYHGKGAAATPTNWYSSS